MARRRTQKPVLAEEAAMLFTEAGTALRDLGPEDEREQPAFATVKVLEVQRSTGGRDLSWHPELHHGAPCPRQCGHTLKRFNNIVYCGTCREQWYSRKMQ